MKSAASESQNLEINETYFEGLCQVIPVLRDVRVEQQHTVNHYIEVFLDLFEKLQ